MRVVVLEVCNRMLAFLVWLTGHTKAIAANNVTCHLYIHEPSYCLIVRNDYVCVFVLEATILYSLTKLLKFLFNKVHQSVPYSSEGNSQNHCEE